MKTFFWCFLKLVTTSTMSLISHSTSSALARKTHTGYNEEFLKTQEREVNLNLILEPFISAGSQAN